MRYWLLATLLANMVLLLVEFHYDAFELVEIKDTENAQPASTQPSALAPSPAENAGNMMEKNDSASKEESVPQSKTSAPATMKLSPEPDIIPTPDETNIRSELNDNANVSKTNSPSSASASPSVTQTSEIKLKEIIQPIKTGTDKQPDFLTTMTLYRQEAKSTGSEEEMEELSKAPENSQNAELPQPPSPTATKTSKIVETVFTSSPTIEPANPKNKTANDTASSIDAVPVQTRSAAMEETRKQDDVLSACYTTGPIKNVQEFNALLDRFRPQLTELLLSPGKTKKTQKRIKYVVYSPAPASMERSLHNANILKSNYGIKDLQVIKDGELKGAISLGVYSNESNAILAKSRLERLGLEVEIAPHFPTNAFYTVRMRWTHSQTEAARQLSDALTRSYPDTNQAVSCK
ncbi:MAG: hypothetical protein ACXWTP_06955 [Methylosarcina sp.]